MKSLTLFSFAILTLTIGCDDVPAQDYGYDNDQNQSDQYQSDQYQDQNNYSNQNPSQQVGYEQSSMSQNNGGDQLTMHILRDKKTGQPLASLPVPASWKFNDNAAPGQPTATGPNGLTITDYPVKTYKYSENPNMNQRMQQYGENPVAPVGIENVMNQQTIPMGRQMGMSLLKQYPMPQITENEIAFYRQFAYSNPRNKIQAMGSEWTDREGNKIFIVLEYLEIIGPMDMTWMYSVSILKAPQANYEKAKGQFIYAISNKNFNQDIITNSNNQVAAQERESNSHFQAMENIRRKGQNDRAKINADANDYVRNLRNQGNAFAAHNNDVVQQQESNYLNDINVVVNPNDGKEYEVESGSNTYWMNNEGEYIKSDSHESLISNLKMGLPKYGRPF